MKRLGDLTFPLIERYVDDIVVVDEVEIAGAVHTLLERQKLLAEGAGAVALAALSSDRIQMRRGEKIVIILSGGNIDLNLVGRIVDRGLVADGRLARLAVTVPDRPGSLALLTRLVAEAGANVLEVAHARAFADISVRDVEIDMLLETRGREHVAVIMAVLAGHGVAVRQDVRVNAEEATSSPSRGSENSQSISRAACEWKGTPGRCGIADARRHSAGGVQLLRP